MNPAGTMLGGMYCSQNRSQPAGFSGRTTQESGGKATQEAARREARQLQQVVKLARRNAAQVMKNVRRSWEALVACMCGLYEEVDFMEEGVVKEVILSQGHARSKGEEGGVREVIAVNGGGRGKGMEH